MKLMNKWKNLSEAAKASLAFAISSFLVKGINLITTPIFTRMMSSAQYGIITTYNSWVSIIEVFALLGLTSAGVFNVGLKEHKQDKYKFMSTTLMLCNLITILVFGVIFLLKIPFGKDFILPTKLLVIMAVGFFFQPAQIFWITSQRYEFKWKAAFVITVVSAVISQSLAVLFLVKFDFGALNLSPSDVKIYATTLGAALLQIPIYVFLLSRGKAVFDKNIWKTTLVFALPLLPHYLAQHVMSSSDKIMISYLNSSSGAAIYGVAMNVSMISTIIWTAINASLVPFTFESLDRNEEKKINSVVLPIVAVYAVMCVGVALIAPEVIRILGPEEYHEGVGSFPPIAATAFIMALYNVYANVEFYHKKSWWITLSTVVAAALNIGLNYLLIPKFGYVGAAYTTFASNLLLIIMHYIGHRIAHKKKIYNDLVIGVILLATIALCLLCHLLYKNDIVRYVIIGVGVVSAVICIKPILKLFKKLKSAKNKPEQSDSNETESDDEGNSGNEIENETSTEETETDDEQEESDTNDDTEV